jgi:hypothetical protein
MIVLFQRIVLLKKPEVLPFDEAVFGCAFCMFAGV